MKSLISVRNGLLIVTLLIVAAAGGSTAWGQVTGAIQGQVTDTSGAVTPGADVRATNENTGVSRTAVTAEDGFYRITDLLPGIYRVRVELPGFKAAVRSGIEVSAKSVVGLNMKLEVGEVSDLVEVRAAVNQVETQVVRISEVLPEHELKSIPMQGRGVLNVTMITPGIVGKQIQSGDYCCDVFSNFATPRLNSGANEQKGAFSLDGVDLRYSEGSGWGMSFSPNPDAIQEVRITTDPQSSAEFGRVSGPQIQITTKGGTNAFHGTAHYLFQDDTFNARPFFSSSVPDTSYDLFGGTFGGPIMKDRLFFFGAYEGLRSTRAGSSTTLVETQAFKDFVTRTRPNSVAAKLLTLFPPRSYPTGGFVDLGSPAPGVNVWNTTPDGIPEMGEITLDNPRRRDGNQYNARIDFHHPNEKDRLFGTYWYSFPKWGNQAVRPAFDNSTGTEVQSLHLTHTRAFTPTSLNEIRFGADYIDFESGIPRDRFPHIPDTSAFDGFAIGSANPAESIYFSDVYYLEEVFSVNKGKHAFKFGATYRNTNLQAGWPNPPYYSFASILDFADDEPFSEDRVIDVKGGQATDTFLEMLGGDFSAFIQNTWQIRSNLTMNYGLRWETFFPVTLGGGKEMWQPSLTHDQLTPQAIAQAKNTPAGDRLYDRDLNNFGPRFGLAWDPSGQGKISVRFGMGILYDEINTFNLYGTDNNPPALAFVSAGHDFGTKVVYGLAPDGTKDYPINPVLTRPVISPAGGIVGQRVTVSAFARDLVAPQTLDTMGGIQYQLTPDLMVQANYKYRRGTKEPYLDDINRASGDLLDGKLDRLNPNFNTIAIVTNRGRRTGHTIITNLTKRFSQGWSLSASYTYANARNNFGTVNEGFSDFYQAGATDAFNLDHEWARDDIPHTFTAHSLWELPIFRGRRDAVGRVLGGWQINTIWNFQAGGTFIPASNAAFCAAPENRICGDFNADGQRVGFRGAGGERPNQPTQSLPETFSKQQWLNGAIPASAFPLPAPGTVSLGTMPRDSFRRPGYANVDVAFVKEFRLPFVLSEEGLFQIRGEFFNIANRLNISNVSRFINSGNFAKATSAHPNRLMQLSLKFLF